MMSKGKNLNAAGRGGRKYRSFPVLGLAALSLLLLAPGPVSAQSPALGLYGGGGGGGAGQPGTTAGAGGAGGAGGLLTDAPGSGGTVPAGAATSPNGTGGGGGAAGDAASIVDGAAGTASGIDSESAGSSSGNSPDLTYRLNRNVTYIDDIEIIAGSGGDAGFAATGPSGAVGNGGNGGSVSLLGPGRTVTVDGRAAPRTITVQSGGVGADNGGVGGSGGDVAVNLNTLRSNGDVTIDLIRGDTVADGGGQIDFRLNTLSVNGGPTTMTFGSSAGVALEDDDIVRFGTLELINPGPTPAIFSTDGNWIADADVGTDAGYSFSHLYVSGRDNVFATESDNNLNSVINNDGRYSPGNVGRITFEAVNVAGGDTMLTATRGRTTVVGDQYGINFTDGIDFTGLAAANLYVYTTYADAVRQSDPGNRVVFIDGVANVAGSDWDTNGTPVVAGQYGSLGVVEYLTDYNDGGGAMSGRLRGYAQTIYDDAYAVNLQANAAALMTARDGYRTVFTTLRNFVETEESNQVLLKASLDGGRFRNKANGGDLNNDTFNFNLGLGYIGQSALGRTTVGAFFEAGSGSYDATEFTRYYGGLTGDGQTEHYGGGLMFHNEFANRFYLELTGRAGRLSNQFGLPYDRLGNFAVPIRGGVNFEVERSYYGAHFGLGYKYDLTDLCELDVYGKFLWTRLGSANFRNEAGESFHMNVADSLRTQLGFRVTQQYMESARGGYDLKGYVGAAWEHEFDGQSSGRVDGRRIDSPHGRPDLQGSSALGEAGLIIQPAGGHYAVDVGIFGSGGQQRGLGGVAALKFEF